MHNNVYICERDIYIRQCICTTYLQIDCLEIGTAVTHARCFWLSTWLPGAKFTTQALLLVESQSGQTLEFTTDACAWQMKTENGWRPVQPQVLSSLDAWTMPGWGIELSHPTCWGSMGMVQVGTINVLPTKQYQG